MRALPLLAAVVLSMTAWAPPADAQSQPEASEAAPVEASDELAPEPEPEPEPEPAPEPEPEPAPEPAPDSDSDPDSDSRTSSDPLADGDPGRYLAIGASILKEHGFSGVLRARYRWVGVEFAGGWSPYILAVTGACNEVIVDGALRVTLSALGFFAEEGDMSHGARAGVLWDAFFGWGAMLGYQVEYVLTEYLVFSAGAGVQIFPFGDEPATRRLARECPSNAIIEPHPLTTYVQPYIGFSLLLYLF